MGAGIDVGVGANEIDIQETMSEAEVVEILSNDDDNDD